MAVLDIRQRTGWLFMGVIVGHILLISAQVNTQRGVPVLEEVAGWGTREIRRLLERHGLVIAEWERVRTDWLTITESATRDASDAAPVEAPDDPPGPRLVVTR